MIGTYYESEVWILITLFTTGAQEIKFLISRSPTFLLILDPRRTCRKGNSIRFPLFGMLWVVDSDLRMFPTPKSSPPSHSGPLVSCEDAPSCLIHSGTYGPFFKSPLLSPLLVDRHLPCHPYLYLNPLTSMQVPRAHREIPTSYQNPLPSSVYRPL